MNNRYLDNYYVGCISLPCENGIAQESNYDDLCFGSIKIKFIKMPILIRGSNIKIFL